MSGTLEQLIAAIQENTAALRSIGNVQQSNANPAVAQVQAAPAPVQPTPHAPEASLLAAPSTPPPSNVTSEQIVALITPHIGNEATKAAFGAAMRGMGINALPEAQPHQYGALYAAFQQVIAQQASAGPAATSII